MYNRSTYRTSIPAIVLLCIYLLNPLKLYLPYLDYKVNYNYIVNFLCENKNKPEVHCEGKCFLSKALKGIEKGETHQKINFKNYLADELPAKEILFKGNTQVSRPYTPEFITADTSSFTEEISPPPRLLA